MHTQIVAGASVVRVVNFAAGSHEYLKMYMMKTTIVCV